MNCLKKVSYSCFALLFALSAYATKPAPEPEPSVVYVTQDVSAKGLKKIYQKLTPIFSGKPTVIEYAPDSFLLNSDESILAKEDSPDALPADLPERFAAALGENSSLRYISPRDKNTAATDWHEFPSLRCVLCNANVPHLGMSEEECKAYPKEQCQSVIDSVAQYREMFTSPKRVVVLSKAKVRGPELYYSGALENMLGGTFLMHEGAPENPILIYWLERISNPKKHTYFITVLSDIPGADGKLHQLGMVGSENFLAAQQEIFRRIAQVNPEFQLKEHPETDLDYLSNEMNTSLLFQALSFSIIPEGVMQAYNKYEAAQQKKAAELGRKRVSEDYKVVSLD